MNKVLGLFCILALFVAPALQAQNIFVGNALVTGTTTNNVAKNATNAYNIHLPGVEASGNVGIQISYQMDGSSTTTNFFMFEWSAYPGGSTNVVGLTSSKWNISSVANGTTQVNITTNLAKLGLPYLILRGVGNNGNGQAITNLAIKYSGTRGL